MLDTDEFNFFKTTPKYRRLVILDKIYKERQKSQNQIARELGYAVSSVNGFFQGFLKQGLIEETAEGYRVTESGKEELERLSRNYSRELGSIREKSDDIQEGIFLPSTAEEIRIGTIKALGTVIPVVAEQEGFFEGEGLTSSIKIYENGRQLMENFVQNELDFACLGLTNVLRAKSETKGVEILSGCNYGGHSIVVQKDIGIHQLSDLRERRILVTPEGTVSHGLLSLLVEKEKTISGIKIETGVTPANMTYALEFNDKIDGMLVWEPYPSQAISEFDNLMRLLDLENHWEQQIGKSYLTNVVIKDSKVSKKISDKFLSAHERTIRLLNHQPERVYDLLGDLFSVSEHVIKIAIKKVAFQSNLRWGSF